MDKELQTCIIIFLNVYFILKTVLDPQQNWVEASEILHLSSVPTHA